MQIAPGDQDILTFDCYGTLVDWEAGLGAALERMFEPHCGPLDRDRLLLRFAHFEEAAEAGGYKAYRQVLAEVADGIAGELGVTLAPGERDGLAESLPNWPVFPDTVEALARLATRYRLGILSNIDDELFAGTSRHLGVSFDPIVTAQQVGSYKPAHANFEELLRRVAVPKERLLHVAQSLFHDIQPATVLGIRNVWVDRRGGAPGGATPTATVEAEHRVTSLAELADLLGCEASA